MSAISPLFLLLPIPLAFFLFLYLILRPRATKIPIKNRHVFISGGSSGIGLALARRAAAQGAKISILARNVANLEKAREEIRFATGIDAGIFSTDVRDEASVAQAIAMAGPIDVLVCNHGIFMPCELEVQSTEVIRAMVEINLMGTIHMIKAALPEMKKRVKETGVPGSIAIVSSQAGQVGVYGYAAYSASKFALKGLAEALQQEVVADNIYVTLIFPADTDTPGLVEENKLRPEISHLIVNSSAAAMKADDVAKKSINGIKSGSFIVPCNFDGTMLAIATAGLSPQSSFLWALIEVFFAGFMRLVGLFTQWKWYSIIEKWHAKNNKK